jgi:endo-1,4-beta-xylanase
VAPHAKLFINDGVGHQMHINVDWPSVAETEAMLQKFIPLGVEQQITEMDVSIYPSDSEWGLADDETWLDTFPVTRKDAPLLFDTSLQAKSAYWGVVDPTKITPTTASPSVSPSPSVNGCTVTYRVTGSWGGGFQGDVKIANGGTTAITGWSLGWSFAAGQKVTQLWNGAVSQNAAAVTVANTSWNGTIAPGGSATFGFLGSWTGTNGVPAVTCSAT